MSKFYSAKQDPEEDVTSWGCRLEDLLAKAQPVMKIPRPEAEQMLRDVFWQGLKAKSRKYQGVFEVKSRVKTWQVRGIWSQQLEH